MKSIPSEKEASRLWNVLYGSNFYSKDTETRRKWVGALKELQRNDNWNFGDSGEG